MYIEFRLPTGAGGAAAGHAAWMIKKNIAAWAEKYAIKYRVKSVNYTLRLCLESEKDYSFFQLSWSPDNHWFNQYTIVYPDGYGRS